MKKKIIIIAVAILIVIVAFVAKGILSKNNGSSENEDFSETTSIIIEPITYDETVSQEESGGTIPDIVIETFAPESETSETESTSETKPSGGITFTIPKDANTPVSETTRRTNEKETIKKNKTGNGEKVTTKKSEVATTKKEKETTKKAKPKPDSKPKPKPTTKPEPTTQKVNNTVPTYKEDNGVIGASNMSLIRNTVMSSISGTYNSNMTNLAIYMAKNGLSNAQSAVEDVCGNTTLKCSAKTARGTSPSTDSEDILDAATKIAQKLSGSAESYGIGINATFKNNKYQIYVVVVTQK